MKKFFYLFIFCLLTTSIVYASSYYVSRTGEILQVGTNIPIKKDMKANLTCNTFSFQYRMDKYYMIKDDGSLYNRKNLVGCEDYSITNIFDPLLLLNSDKITEKLTSNELKSANIRFVKLKSPMGQLDIENKKNDFDLDKIAYIDLSKLDYFSYDHAQVRMYLRPNNENSYYSNSKYMKELFINIQSKSKQQADRMF